MTVDKTVDIQRLRITDYEKKSIVTLLPKECYQGI